MFLTHSLSLFLLDGLIITQAFKNNVWATTTTPQRVSCFNRCFEKYLAQLLLSWNNNIKMCLSQATHKKLFCSNKWKVDLSIFCSLPRETKNNFNSRRTDEFKIPKFVWLLAAMLWELRSHQNSSQNHHGRPFLLVYSKTRGYSHL